MQPRLPVPIKVPISGIRMSRFGQMAAQRPCAMSERKSKPKQADILIAIANAAALFHTPAPDSDAFAEIMIGGHRETHRVRGRSFREWLRHQYFEFTGSACNSDALREAVETIAAKAQYKAPEYNVYVRIAGIDESSTSILAIRLGGRYRSRRLVGGSSMRCRSVSSAHPAPRRCRCRNAAVRSGYSGRSAI